MIRDNPEYMRRLALIFLAVSHAMNTSEMLTTGQELVDLAEGLPIELFKYYDWLGILAATKPDAVDVNLLYHIGLDILNPDEVIND
jgi:hypothetical protein